MAFRAYPSYFLVLATTVHSNTLLVEVMGLFSRRKGEHSLWDI